MRTSHDSFFPPKKQPAHLMFELRASVLQRDCDISVLSFEDKETRGPRDR